MKLRYLLLASTVLPLAMGYPVLALERPSSPILLAQADQPPCPEGQECPPAGSGGSTGEAPPPEQPAPEQPVPEQPAPEQPAAEQPLPQDVVPLEPAPAPPAVEQQPEQPAPQDVAPQEPAPEPPAAEQPPEQPAPQDVVPQKPEPVPAEQPAPEQPAPVQPAEPPAPQDLIPQEPAGELPAPQGAAPEPPAPVAPSPDVGTAPPQEPPPAEDTTVEQQLDAQGDQGEANNVRALRERLQQQLQGAVGTGEGGQSAGDQGNDTGPNTDGSRDRRRGNRDNGWWNRDEGNDVVQRRGGRIVIDLGNGNLSVEPVAPDEGGRLLYGADDVEVQNLPRGQTRTIVHRRNGVDIVTVRDRYGDIVKRSKILPDGTEIVLIDNRFPDDYQGGRPPVLYDVPPPVVHIPQDQYIVDYGDASEDDIRGALRAPPVQQIARPYTLDEVLQNEQVRAYSPRIDLDSITFETGSATIGNDQMRALFSLGQAMEQVIAENPDEVYLIEGHTDAVGRAGDNLILSDQRAESVATALSQNFDIPPENLVTQGYGEEYLKVNTEAPERRNRRAAVRRLTELLQAQQ